MGNNIKVDHNHGSFGTRHHSTLALHAASQVCGSLSTLGPSHLPHICPWLTYAFSHSSAPSSPITQAPTLFSCHSGTLSPHRSGTDLVFYVAAYADLQPCLAANLVPRLPCRALMPSCSYCCFLLFQLVTHKDLFDDQDMVTDHEVGEGGEEPGAEQPVLTFGAALFMLTTISLTVAVHSE